MSACLETGPKVTRVSLFKVYVAQEADIMDAIQKLARQLCKAT